MLCLSYSFILRMVFFWSYLIRMAFTLLQDIRNILLYLFSACDPESLFVWTVVVHNSLLKGLFICGWNLIFRISTCTLTFLFQNWFSYFDKFNVAFHLQLFPDSYGGNIEQYIQSKFCCFWEGFKYRMVGITNGTCCVCRRNAHVTIFYWYSHWFQ